MPKTKNPHLRVEYRVKEEGDRSYSFAADSEEECVTWIEDHTPADLMGDVTYFIQKVYTTSRKKNK